MLKNPLTDINLHVDLHRSKGYALLVAILPVVQLIITPGLQVGLATTIIAATMVYAGCVAYRHSTRIDPSIMLAALPYLLYVYYRGETEERLLAVAITTHLVAFSTGAVCPQRLRTIAENVAVAAALLAVAQQLLYFGTGLKIQFLLNEFIIPSHRMAMHESLFSGTVESSGLYRPSAFFEEPSHMAQYSLVGLVSCLFRDEARTRKALPISTGMFACTAGMGIVLTFAIWGWWRLTAMKGASLNRKVALFTTAVVCLPLLFLLLNEVPFFAHVFSRFMDTPEGEYNAIEGRTFAWDLLFKGRSFDDLLWGEGPAAEQKYYLTGFMKQLFMYGWAGVILLYTFLLRLVMGTHGAARTIAIAFSGLYFIAGVSGFIPLIYYTGCIVTLDQEQHHCDDADEGGEES